MTYMVKAVKKSKTFMLAVEPGEDVRIHDSHGDPSSLSVLFDESSAVAKLLVAAATPEDVAALVRLHAPGVWAFAIVAGRITLLLRMEDGSEVFLHKDADGSLGAHGTDFSKIELESLFRGDCAGAIEKLSKSASRMAMIDVLESDGRPRVVSVSAPNPFHVRPTEKAMERALDLIAAMLEPGFDAKEARAFLLDRGRSISILSD
ncbi:hypothetical protein [Rhizobium sp. BK176]|uniref:hypothetical protein n=1 Tax=Rhizobium sp. BK176 TaxID=2587071 RepID=UPI002168344D|nr:hypothetical protein [Rhizobium sp. BK176]MCS4090187.1 hypothetical protein [Rhizobium sp. BK176]